MISIIILVQDRFEVFERCLKSVVENTKSDYEIVFIDQATQDRRIRDLIDWYFSLGKRGLWLRNDFNNGVTPGRNQGILLARGEFLLFFDDDAFVSNDLSYIPEEERHLDWLERMTRYFYLDEKVGVVGQTGSYIVPERPGVFWEAKGRGVECDVAQGYCFMFSRKVVEAIGLLDPYFGRFWHEESEYALRAKAAGFKVIDADYIGVTHYGSGSGDDGTYRQKIDYLFQKWRHAFDKILVPREKWSV